MATPSRISQRVRFGEFELDLSTRELRTNGTRQTLAPQPFQVLQILIENRGQLVGRDALVSHLWPSDTFVDYEQGLKKAVNRLREALNDSAEQPRFIETLPRQGYRFIGNLEFDTAVRDRFADAVVVMPKRVSDEAAEVTRPKPIPSFHWLWVPAVVALGIAGILFWRSRVSRNVPSPTGEPKLTQLTVNSIENPVTSSAISPDGKYLAFTDHAMRMHVRLLATGETLTIPEPESLKGTPVEWSIAAWFPDSTRFLVNAGRPPDDGRMFFVRSRLESHLLGTVPNPASGVWVVSLLGKAPQAIREDGEAFSVSPDGSSIAFGRNPGSIGDREIWLMNAKGMQARKLFDAPDNSAIGGLAWSHNGQRVIYFEGNNSGGRLVSRDLRGGPAVPLVSFSAWHSLNDFVWLADERLIYVRRVQPGSRFAGLWEMHVDPRKGVPLDAPRQITTWSDIGIDEISASADGRQVAVQRSSWQTTVNLAELAAGGSRTSSMRRLTLNDYLNAAETWTPDSRALVFRSVRNGHIRLFLQRIDSDSEEPLVMGAEDVGGTAISPDGQWLYYQDCGAQQAPACEGVISVMAIPIRGGEAHFVLKADTDQRPRCTVAPANLCFVTERTSDERQIYMTAFDALKGRGSEIARFDIEPGADYMEAPSPDGTHIAIKKHWDKLIHIISLKEQPTREITIKHWNNMAGIYWAADGKGWFTVSKDQTGVVLLYVDFHGEAHPLWEQKGNTAAYGLPSPDGRRLAIVATARSNNVWMMENF